MVFKLDKCYIKIQECDNGYDYSIYNNDYDLIDGGVYENLEYKIYDVLEELIIENGLINNYKVLDYDDFNEIIEEKEMLKFDILKRKNSNI